MDYLLVSFLCHPCEPDPTVDDCILFAKLCTANMLHRLQRQTNNKINNKNNTKTKTTYQLISTIQIHNLNTSSPHGISRCYNRS